MKILLLQDVKGVGRRNEVKNVSDGYARNFLIPRGFAKPADTEALKEKSARDAGEEALVQKIQEQAEKLRGETLMFSVKTGKNDEVFGSVTDDDIKKALHAKGYSEVSVELSHHLKELGRYSVRIQFPRGVAGDVTVELTPEQ